MWILMLFMLSQEGIQFNSVEFKSQTNCMMAMYDFKQAMKLSKVHIKSICVKK